MPRPLFAVLIGIVAVFAPVAPAPADTVHHLDPTFGDAGLVTTLGPLRAVVRQGDGTFLVGGSTAGDFIVARFTAAGTIDPTFGTAGIAQVDVSGDVENLFAIAVQSDGKIVAVGEAEIDEEEEFAMTRLNADGTIDTAFGTGGRVVSGAEVEPYDVVLQADGGIVVIGTDHATPTVTVFALARFDASGALDPTFGPGGVVHSTLLASTTQQAWGVALQSDGKIIAAGYGGDNVLSHDFLVARYLTDGTLDTSFGDGGHASTSISFVQDIAWDVVVQPDDKIVLGGGYYPSLNRTGFALVRYLPEGTLDSSFGEQGIVRTAFSRNSKVEPVPDFAGYHAGYVYALALAADGRIIAAGNSIVARYLANGSLDPTFGGGSIHTLLPDARVPFFFGLAVQPDGKVVAVGSPYQSTGTNTGILARYAPCVCPACQRCDGLGGCVIAPETDCYEASTTSLKLRNSGSAVAWKFAVPEAIPAEAVGLPYETTDYSFCIYDESAPSPTVAVAASLPAGSACGGKRCWKTTNRESAASYKGDDSAGPIRSAKIKTGPLYEGSIQVKGKGAALGLPAFPLGAPLRVQLQAENGQCWQSVYDANDVVLSDTERFEAR